MLGADAMVKCLEAEGVKAVFGYPGVAICPFYNSILESDIESILVRTEQNAAHAASGLARVTDGIGVCAVTSGPGATNLITGIATAFADSIPMICITGQVNSELLGSDVFQEADITGATESFVKYSYLVKKVVFKISIIPIIKIIAATFTHMCFVALMLIFYIAMGYSIDIHLVQLLYYSFCMFMFVLAISYSTCAIVIFFRDLLQIINIALQIGMWATPILWNIASVSELAQKILKINPVFYIVNGYRSAMFEKTWFWEDFYSTMYFWIVTFVFFGIGALIFRRLKVHFADVL